MNEQLVSVCCVEGLPVGGVILNYLLEKSRVVRQTAGEENFHVFYELVYGADSSLLSTLHLTADTDDYHYTHSQVSSHSVSQSVARKRGGEIRGLNSPTCLHGHL